MSGTAEARELEERLREAAALGDVEEVRRLLGEGADINSRNEINGWTCLHWACKRNHAPVVSCLLGAGANKQILTAKGELPVQLTSKPDIRKMLGEEETECEELDLNLPVVANYLASPPLPYIYTGDSTPDSLGEDQNESASTSSASQCETSPGSSSAQADSACTPTSCQSEEEFPALDATEPPPALAAAVTAPELMQPGAPDSPEAPDSPKALNGPGAPISSRTPDGPGAPNSPEALNSPGAPNSPEALNSPGAPNSPKALNSPTHHPPTPHGLALFSPAAPKRAVPLQTDSSPTGPTPTFQPFFFSGTFPYNMQELVLKVRVQNIRDSDFIEIELDRQELTYQDLLRVSCCELGVNPEHVEKIRKLPNTLVRKDKDVARLQDFQELELVLMKSNSSPFRTAASALSGSPCYNSRASKLTY